MRIKFILILLLILLSLYSQTEENSGVQIDGHLTNQIPGYHIRSGQATAPIPFEIFLDNIIIPGMIGDSLEVNLILDTGFGSPGILLTDPAWKDELQVNFIGETILGGGGEEDLITADIAIIDSLTFTGIAFYNQLVIIPRENIQTNNWGADGIIGGSLFDCVVEIDYEKNLLIFYEQGSYLVPEGRERLDLTFSYGIPAIQAGVIIEEGEEFPLTLLTDTGAGPLILLSFSADELKLPGKILRAVEGELGEGLSGRIYGSIGRIKQLRFGSYTFQDVIATYPDESSWESASQLQINGIIGHEHLKRFHLVFDYSEKALYLQPNENFADPSEFFTCGFVAVFTSELNLKVEDLFPGSEAEQQGMQKHDEIVTINGIPTPDYSYPELYGLLTSTSGKINLGVRRGQLLFELELTLKRFI